MTKSAVWAATATALSRLRLDASPAAGGRSAATGTPCAALGTAAVTVRALTLPSFYCQLLYVITFMQTAELCFIICKWCWKRQLVVNLRHHQGLVFVSERQ